MPDSCISYINISSKANNGIHFSLYSVFQCHHHNYVMASILFVIFITSLCTNMTILYAVIIQRKLRTRSNLLVANIAVADVGFACCIPFTAITALTESWIFGDHVCRLVTCLHFVGGAVLLSSLTLISLDRYRRIVVPPIRKRFTVHHILAIICAIWVTCFALSTPLLLQSKEEESTMRNETIKICTIEPEHTSTILCFAIFGLVTVLPSCALIFSYCKIFQKIRQRHQWSIEKARTSVLFNTVWYDTSELVRPTQVAPSKACQMVFTYCAPNHPVLGSNPAMDGKTAMSSVQDPSVFEASESKCPINSNRQVPLATTDKNWTIISSEWFPSTPIAARPTYGRTSIILLTNVIVFFVMWTPLTSVTIYLYYDSSQTGSHSIGAYAFHSCLALAYANSCANTIVYGLLNHTFRHWFSSVWKRN